MLRNNFQGSVQKLCARHITMLLWKWTCEYCVNIWKTLVSRRSNAVACTVWLLPATAGQGWTVQECAGPICYIYAYPLFFCSPCRYKVLHPEFFCALQHTVLRRTNKQTTTSVPCFASHGSAAELKVAYTQKLLCHKSLMTLQTIKNTTSVVS